MTTGETGETTAGTVATEPTPAQCVTQGLTAIEATRCQIAWEPRHGCRASMNIARAALTRRVPQAHITQEGDNTGPCSSGDDHTGRRDVTACPATPFLR